jgi:hypothetical protein
MRYSLKRRSITSMLCAILVVGGALAMFSFSLWAERGRRVGQQLNKHEMLRLAEASFHKWRSTPSGYKSVPARNPFGGFTPLEFVEAGQRGQYFETPSGFVSRGGLDKMRRQMPQFAAARKPKSLGGRGEIDEGFAAIRLKRDAVKNRGIESIERDLAAMGVTIHERMPNRALLVEIPARAVERLGGADFLEASMVWGPPVKIGHRIGRGVFLEKRRAEKLTYDLNVNFFRGTRPEKALEQLRGVLGPDRVAIRSVITRRSFKVTDVSKAELAKISRIKRVHSIEAAPEYLLMGVETPTTATVGNIKDNLPFQTPYHDVGIDGGGLDTSGDGIRDNRNSNPDEVPPQIVAVTDNGISYDSVQFSQTRTQPTIPIFNPIGTRHRKVHSIQDVPGVGNGGSGCDSPLSGGGTHGNVVAGIIAGEASSFGERVEVHIVHLRPKVGDLKMDGVARGARILFQDAAGGVQCPDHALMEYGGNVSPGSLADRLALAVCPKTAPLDGPCAGIIGGGEEAHLHVLPFGVPNFDNDLSNSEAGSYSQDSADVDAFLVNHRDYMVFAPVGNAGTTTPMGYVSFQGENSSEYPDLFDGTAFDDSDAEGAPLPGRGAPLQIGPPATAKNLVTVGSHFQDVQTQTLGNLEENVNNFTAKGPATAASGRMSPGSGTRRTRTRSRSGRATTTTTSGRSTRKSTRPTTGPPMRRERSPPSGR